MGTGRPVTKPRGRVLVARPPVRVHKGERRKATRVAPQQNTTNSPRKRRTLKSIMPHSASRSMGVKDNFENAKGLSQGRAEGQGGATHPFPTTPGALYRVELSRAESLATPSHATENEKFREVWRENEGRNSKGSREVIVTRGEDPKNAFRNTYLSDQTKRPKNDQDSTRMPRSLSLSPSLPEPKKTPHNQSINQPIIRSIHLAACLLIHHVCRLSLSPRSPRLHPTVQIIQSISQLPSLRQISSLEKPGIWI